MHLDLNIENDIPKERVLIASKQIERIYKLYIEAADQ